MCSFKKTPKRAISIYDDRPYIKLRSRAKFHEGRIIFAAVKDGYNKH